MARRVVLGEADEREMKLPAWARAELAALRARVGALEAARLEERAKLPVNSKVILDRYGDWGLNLPIIGLDERAEVTFWLGRTGSPDWAHRGVENEVSVRLQRDHEDVPYVNVIGSSLITLEPAASNVMRVKLVAR
jgi:hypothetical protein